MILAKGGEKVPNIRSLNNEEATWNFELCTAISSKFSVTLLDVDKTLHAFSRSVVHDWAPQAHHDHQHLDHLDDDGDCNDDNDDDNEFDNMV